MSVKTPSKWASRETIEFLAKTITRKEVAALIEFVDRVDALLIDETRCVASGFTVRDARHNLMRSTTILSNLRADVTR